MFEITQNVSLEFFILTFSTHFCPIVIDLSGNTVWPCSVWAFLYHSKCKRSSLRSQCWMWLILWLSNTVHQYTYVMQILIGMKLKQNSPNSKKITLLNNPCYCCQHCTKELEWNQNSVIFLSDFIATFPLLPSIFENWDSIHSVWKCLLA